MTEKHQLDQLATEQRNPLSSELDTLTSEEIVSLLLQEDRTGLDAALAHKTRIAKAAGWMANSLSAGGKIYFAGAGTSGRLGVLEAAECPPTFGTEPEQVQALIAGGREAVFSAQEGAEDSAEKGAGAASVLLRGDILLGISASSVTPWVRGALTQARAGGIRTILLTCTGSAKLDGLADLVIGLETGPEILTGSTRLKAGSATKAVLNAMTTTAMVRLGKVHHNLMVDLRPGSAKLRERAVRIVAQATHLDTEAARTVLEEAEGEVKTAIVMAAKRITVEEARLRLDRAEGHIRPALVDSDR